MKSNLLCTLTLGVFLVCALYTVWLALTYYYSVQQLQQLQFQYVRVEQTQNAIQALASDAMEYGKQHPAIEPLLQQYDLKPKPAPAAGKTNAPAK